MCVKHALTGEGARFAFKHARMARGGSRPRHRQVPGCHGRRASHRSTDSAVSSSPAPTVGDTSPGLSRLPPLRSGVASPTAVIPARPEPGTTHGGALFTIPTTRHGPSGLCRRRVQADRPDRALQRSNNHNAPDPSCGPRPRSSPCEHTTIDSLHRRSTSERSGPAFSRDAPSVDAGSGRQQSSPRLGSSVMQ